MKAELLAPAGSYEAMEAAFRAGADAVYLGGTKFGARAYADNLDQERLISAIDYAHIHGKQLYLTVNTLLKNKEIERELYDYLKPYYEAGLDAVIVQDLGVMEFVKRHFPSLPIHASTQMTITGPKGAKLIKEAGASRVVTARELSLKEIKEIYDETGVEIESFVHGALCYCYSGQCLMSSLIGGRSGNRGRCAQPCRLPYEVWKDGKRLNKETNAYALSPKDMCTVGILPEIMESGVFSLKIEGRMKKPEYSAGVVEIYRKYLDRYLKGEKRPVVSAKDYQTLMDIYNRDGFHQSYYKVRNGREMMALLNEKKTATGEDIKNVRNEALFERLRQTYLEGKYQEKITGTLSLYEDCPAVLEVVYKGHRIVEEGAVVQIASNRPLEEERIRKQVMKTGDTAFVFETLDVFMGDSIFLPMQQLNELRRTALERLEQEILRPYRRSDAAPYCALEIDETKTEKEELLSGAVCTKEQLEALLLVEQIGRIYADCGMFSKENFQSEVTQAMKKVKAKGKQFYLWLPHIVRDKELAGRKESFVALVEGGLDGFLIRNLESAGILKESGLLSYAVLDSNLYTLNGEAQKFWKEQEVLGDTISLELNKKELRFRDNTKSECCVYGYLPMMVSVQCVQKNFDKCNHKHAHLILKDRYKKEFPVLCNCEFCYNTIYNTLPLSLAKEAQEVKNLGISRYRLNFTLENREETERIAKGFAKVYLQNQQMDAYLSQLETTKGHFARGVE